MQLIDEPIEEDDTTGDVLLVRANEVTFRFPGAWTRWRGVPLDQSIQSESDDTHADEATDDAARHHPVRGDASGARTSGDEWHLVKEVTCGSNPDESPTDESVESISDRVQRQVSEALLVLDAVADEIRAVGLALVEAGKHLGDEDHDRMLHWATELAGIRQQVRKVQRSIGERRDYLNVRSG